jgi:hypothetical protein
MNISYVMLPIEIRQPECENCKNLRMRSINLLHRYAGTDYQKYSSLSLVMKSERETASEKSLTQKRDQRFHIMTASGLQFCSSVPNNHLARTEHLTNLKVYYT